MRRDLRRRFRVSSSSCGDVPNYTVVVVAVLILASIIAADGAGAAPPSTCGASDDYSRALCAYQFRSFGEAEAGFRSIAERSPGDASTIRATYFLARTLMKVGRFEEAEVLLVRIYGMSKAFYEEWNCDFLLGLCRTARGKW